MLTLLQNSRFRLLLLSTVFNDLGLMMYFTAHGWLALTITDSAFWVGATAGMNGLGLLSFSIFAGVLADRLERRKLIIGTLIVQVVSAFILAALIFTDSVQLWHVLVIAYIDGVMIAVKIPSRMALTLDVVGRQQLLSATATNFASMTIMGVFMPLIGGFIIAVFDIGWVYVIMGIAYLVSAVLMSGLRLGAPAVSDKQKASPWQDLKEGVRYVFGTREVRGLILMALSLEAFGWAHETILPVMARDVLDVGPQGLGYLLSAGSAGAFISTVVISNLGDVKQKRRMLVVGYIAFGGFLMLFAASPWLITSLLLLAAAYSAVAIYETTLSTLLQTNVPDAMRGRVLSFQIMTWGVTGFSGFHTGAVAALLGAPIAIAAGGGVVVLNGVRFIRRALQSETPQPEIEPAVGD